MRLIILSVPPDEARSKDLATASRRIAEDQLANRILVLAIIVQCLLYAVNLALLPMWSDETFTVQTAAESPAHIIQTVRDDIHPPLYFLLAHWWEKIPIGSEPLLKLRALSALFAIATTLFLGRRFLRSAPANLRHWFLLFWVLSPCLLLYARMARSYSLQLLLSAITVWFLLEFVKTPFSGKPLSAFTLSLVALLYTTCLASRCGRVSIYCCFGADRRAVLPFGSRGSCATYWLCSSICLG